MKKGLASSAKQISRAALLCLVASVSALAVTRIENTVIIDNPQKTTLHIVLIIQALPTRVGRDNI
jgi:hypothetical protein